MDTEGESQESSLTQPREDQKTSSESATFQQLKQLNPV